MATKITLEPLLHRNMECIAIRFGPDKEIAQKIRQIKAAKWTQTHRCWYVPMQKEHYLALKALSGTDVLVEETALAQYGTKRKMVAATQPAPDKGNARKPMAATPAFGLSAANLQELQRFVTQLKLKAYSNSTINTYRSEFLQLLKLLGPKIAHNT